MDFVICTNLKISKIILSIDRLTESCWLIFGFFNMTYVRGRKTIRTSSGQLHHAPYNGSEDWQKQREIQSILHCKHLRSTGQNS